MRSFKKWSAVMISAVLVASLLAGCTQSSGSKGTTEPAKKEPVSLNIWTHMTEDEGKVLDTVAQEWAKQTSNTVTVNVDKGDMSAFPTVAASGKGPDIMFGLPHDNLGGIYKAGLLVEVPAGLVNKDDFVPASLDAASFDGKLYGIPIAMETYALFYRTDKIKEPPKTWAEFEKLANEKGFVYDIKNFYFSFGFVQSEGGYVFKNNGGALDPNDIGLANDGAIKGFQLISDMVNKYGWMKADITGDIAKGKFQAGDAAMYLSGPWDVGGFRKANVPFAVAPMPTLPDGNKFHRFEGVYASFVSSTSKHQQEAWELEKYLIEHAGLPLFKTGGRFPVQKALIASPDVQSDAISSGFGKAALDATPMPNIAQMGQVWTPMADALTLITSKKATPKDAAQGAVKKLKEAIAQSK